MKVFKFPGCNLSQLDTITTAKNTKLQKQCNSKSPKHNTFKKSGSLDLSYYFLNKNKQLQRVYRANSFDKKTRAKSTNSSKSTKQLKQYVKISCNPKIRNPKKQLNCPEKKIFLKTEKKGRYLYHEIKSILQLINQKLIKCTQAKSQKLFLQQYSNMLKSYHQLISKQNQSQIIKTFIDNLLKCQNKKYEKRIQGLSDRIIAIEKQRSAISIQIKKAKLKQQVLNEQIKKITDRNIELSKQIRKYKQRTTANQMVQTECIELEKGGNFPNQVEKQFPKLIQQLRQLRQKENHVNILVGQLRRDGIDVEKTYKRGLKHIQKKAAKENAQQNSQSSQDQIQNRLLSQNNANKKQENKKDIENQMKGNNFSSCDADNSIIDDIEALSFNYAQKQTQPQTFTPRHVYICQKPIEQSLKKKLKLNFDCLYQYEEVTDQNEQDDQNFPTI